MTNTLEKSPAQNRPLLCRTNGNEQQASHKQIHANPRGSRAKPSAIATFKSPQCLPPVSDPKEEKPPISLERFRKTSHSFPDLPQFEYCNSHLRENQSPLGESIHHQGYNHSHNASSRKNTPTRKYIPYFDRERDHFLERAEFVLALNNITLSQLPPKDAQYLTHAVLISNEFIDSYESIMDQMENQAQEPGHLGYRTEQEIPRPPKTPTRLQQALTIHLRQKTKSNKDQTQRHTLVSVGSLLNSLYCVIKFPVTGCITGAQ